MRVQVPQVCNSQLHRRAMALQFNMGRLRWMLGLAVFGLTIIGCLGQEPGRNPGQPSTPKSADKKPCYIVDQLRLGPNLKGNPDVECLQDGSISIAPIPDLQFEGVKYSTIDYSRDKLSPPGGYAIKTFNESKADGPEKLAFLKRSKLLYESVWLGLRSVDLNKHMRTIRELEIVIAFLNFQVHRFESEAPEIELALANVLKRCPQCSVKDSYNMIALASQSGVNPDKFLEGLPGLNCKSQQECTELINKGRSNIKSKSANPAASPNAAKNFIKSNPAISSSSRLLDTGFLWLALKCGASVLLPLFYT